VAHPDEPSGRTERRLSVDYLGWHTQSESLYRSAFESGIVVLDANVLLTLYEVGSGTRDEVFDALRAIAHRMWVPHQAALEFSRNRRRVVVDRVSNFRRVRRNVQSATKEAIGILESAVDEVQSLRKRNRTSRSWDLGPLGLDHDSLNGRFEGVMDAAMKEIAELEAEHDLRPEHMQTFDSVFREIDDLLAGRIGSPLPAADVRALVQEAIEFRFPNKIPPGHEDSGKPTEIAAAGDYLLWYETLMRARGDSTSDSVLLVTDESKPDWWEEGKNGKVMGPRPELIQEMRDVSNKTLVLASLADLLAGVGRYLLADVSSETVRQVRDVQAEAFIVSTSTIEAHASASVDLLNLSWKDFETLIGSLLRAMGYVVHQPHSMKDLGFDFLAIDYAGVAAVTIVVEVKRSRHSVAANIVRQIVGAMQSINGSRGLIVATGHFTSAAIDEALRMQVRLIDGQELIRLIRVHLGITATIGASVDDE
jgi:hypothetical protein